MKKNIELILLTSFLIAFNIHLLIAQDIDSLSSNESVQTEEINKDVKTPNQDTNQNYMKESFTDFYSTRTTILHSIGIGVGDQLSLWYYYMTPLIRLERIKYISFGLGFGGKGVGYVTYKENGDLIDPNDNSYFYFFGGSVGLTFFVTDRIFLHSADSLRLI